MSLNEMIKCVEDSDDWLTKTKQIIQQHEGEEIEEDSSLANLLDLVKMILKNQYIIKQMILDEYGVFVFTEN